MQSALRHTLRPLAFVVALLLVLPLQPASADAFRFTGVERVVVVGDVHGALDELVAILQGTGLADDDLSWRGGDAHLVSLGDLLDRGDLGRQVMDLLMRLQAEAAEAGGAVHVVLGNHEAMNLTGDLRYVSAGDYAQFGADLDDGLPPGFVERHAAFAPDGDYGRWLLDMPAAIAIDDTLFIHAGVSSLLEGLTLAQINEAAQRDVRRFAESWHALIDAGELGVADDFDAILARASALRAQAGDASLRLAATAILEASDGLPFVPDGPLWYRGSARCHPYTETVVAEGILAQLEVRRVAIGHTPTFNRRITSRLEDRVILVDTGMNADAYRGRPAALLIEGGKLRAWYADGGAGEIEAEPHRIWSRPDGMTDDEIEEFLLTADVVQSAQGDDGRKDRVRTVTLEKDGRRLEAVFNTVDTSPGLQQGRWTRAAARAERYAHELAAYRLDRLIDLQMVPVTVERRIGEQQGALRLLVDGSFSEEERQARELRFTGSCDLATQYELMGLFDALIYNREPALGRLRYDRLWQLWLMDQSKAFSPGNVDAALRRAGLAPSPQLAAALARITPESVAPLAAYLHPRQLEALLARVEQLRAQR
jgi:hypothetical protein